MTAFPFPLVCWKVTDIFPTHLLHTKLKAILNYSALLPVSKQQNVHIKNDKLLMTQLALLFGQNFVALSLPQCLYYY